MKLNESGFRITAPATASLALAAALLATTSSMAQADGITITPGIEVLSLGFFASQGTGSSVENYFPDYGVNTAIRYTISAASDAGLGVRLRYFEFDETEPHFGTDRRAVFEMLDAEAFFPVFTGDSSSAEAFIGVRSGNIELSGADFGGVDPYQFEGTGLTLGASFAHQINNNFGLNFGGRYSIMAGDATFTPVSTNVLSNTIVQTFDLFAGVEYMRSFRGADLRAHFGYEVQFYGTDSVYFPFAIDPETIGDTGLMGLTLGLNVSF
ncbi:Lpg1974 family pore-forming outer membrane protein [Roseicyclus persicicus]|uniref:Outer membrane protein beta-barrel domain-containing protein n=1 Tax=Roseicyclus persicicus TaxID=2650661 RepID=A0A7X6JWL9_9RHOB|nr:Lpg1974 family pore-forming outer membrane protein [Roseibacterium persicicum]NKX44577.1 hypothetical protein [Roseibacterium persicicum]